MEIFKYKKNILLSCAFVIFVLSFQGNFFNAASKNFFDSHQRDSESLVLGRVVETHNKGHMSNGGFLGRYQSKDYVGFQYRTYLNNSIPESQFQTYNQSFGLQGYFYATIDTFLRFFNINAGETRLFIKKLVTSSLLAALLVLFIYFVQNNFSSSAAIITTVLLALSQWVVVFSNNLYWVFFLTILPFIVVTTFFQFNTQDKSSFFIKKLYLLYIYIFLAIFIKSLSGYEYISTVLIATVVPLIFFAIRDSWSFKLFFERFALISTFGLLGFFAAILTHLLKLAIILGGFTKGFEHLWLTIARRTHGDPNIHPEILRASLESNILDVILKYWDGKAFNLNALIGFGESISFGEIIIILLSISLLMLVLPLFLRHSLKSRKLNLAIVITLWFSVLAPFSWFILAKGHSYIHVHMNHILWYVPFLLIGFAYLGHVIKLISSQIMNLSFNIKIYLLVVLTPLILIPHLINVNENNKIFNKYFKNSYKITDLDLNRKLSLYYNKNEAVFVSETCDKKLFTRFFLHIIPKEVIQLPQNRRKYKFDNLDFSWSNKKNYSYTSYGFIKNICIAAISLKEYPIKRIRTGQYRKAGKLWERSIDLSDKRFTEYFNSANFNDFDWVKGISQSRSAVLLENTFANRQSIRVGDKLIFNKSGIRIIEKISYSSSYINLSVSGGKLSPKLDGNQNKIYLWKKTSEKK